MIEINMKMPEKCGLCPCFHHEYPIYCQAVKVDRNNKKIVAPYGSTRPEWCPLKEQEPIKPIYNEEKYGDHLPHCGSCEKVLPNNAVYGKIKFCHYCGKAVKWND